MDWKNRLERTIGVNTAIMKAEQQNFLNKKVIEDLERKNKALHRCAFTAHNTVSEWIKLYNTGVTQDEIFNHMKKLIETMEEILNEGTTETKPLENSSDASGVIT